VTLEAAVAGREQIADWIETTLLARGTRQMGEDELNRLAAVEVGAGPAQVSFAQRVMELRSATLGDRYPFTVSSLAVRARNGAMATPYSALVLLSSGSVARQLLPTSSTSEMEVLFERIAEAGLARLWGAAGRALRFGWPSDVGRPPEFGPAIAWLANSLGVPIGAGYRPPIRKDGGVDVVAWCPFPDGRSGFMVVLAQCTLQADLISKAADVEPRVWASWLKMDVDPVVALVVPQTISDDRLWGQLALRGMVLERIRLAGLLPPDVQIQGLDLWVTNTLDSVRPYLGGAQD
jgi:hypothetical protein